MNSFFELMIVLAPFITAISIVTVVLWHKRRVMEINNDTDIDVLQLSEKVKELTIKVERLESELREQKKISG
ncbi:hypothetical protein [Evansella cellulosilytica]|uniref:Phage shock protein B n=1 Tax=Evansella cellulosilytica (strain ATCC 21833 / DSM 2522 / FERM P-1141 / JCM 9156 / N-4) TaxID=649639 RepID=E6TUR7_EVAC2|nr:hypothetical protein [Evansella cellulosilytica]ADU32069.1 hypothetical protein Bcell_3830 [Evansella cellulosilytica DSM 2522]